MASSIDATKPVDGVPAVKGDLRTNLGYAKSEIEALQDTAVGGHVILSVKDFGAYGDNSHDDTDAINDCIDAAPSYGAIILFPRGIYLTAGTIVIPISSGICKPVILVGEGGGILDGNVGGWAGGASQIKYTGSGVCIDAFGTRSDQFTPWWAGGIADLAIHDAGSGTIGLKANALLSARFTNVLFRGFDTNVWVQGEYFYSYWFNVQSYRGAFKLDYPSSGQGPKANGALFFYCQFSEYGGTDAALQFGETNWPGQFINLDHCYLEKNNGPGISCKHGSGLMLFHVYFEECCMDNPDNPAFIVYSPPIGLNGELVLDTCYARITDTGIGLVEYSGGSGSEGLISIKNMHVSAESSGHYAIMRDSGTTTNPSIIAIGNRTNSSSQSMPIYNGTIPGQTLNFTSIDCGFTEDFSGLGRTNIDVT